MNYFEVARGVRSSLFVLASLGATLGVGACSDDAVKPGVVLGGERGTPEGQGADAPGGGQGAGAPGEGQGSGEGVSTQSKFSLSAMCFPNPPPITVYEPLPVTVPVATACEEGRPASLQPASVDEALSLLAGRWALCAGDAWTAGFGHDFVGIEFNGQGRWQMLLPSGQGMALDPATRGRVSVTAVPPGGLPGSFLVDMTADQWGGLGVYVSWSDDRATMAISSMVGRSTLVRVEPGSLDDNPLPAPDGGRCSLIGTWDVVAPGDAVKASLLFAGDGYWVGGEPEADVCTEPTIRGTYGLSPELFSIFSSEGLGCEKDASSGYSHAFSNDCNTVTMTRTIEGCWVERPFFSGSAPTVLRRHPTVTTP